MRIPQKAVILSAGLGTRLRPLTETTPKPLLPLWGTPVIEHTVNLLSNWGITDILINVHHIPEKFQKALSRKMPVRLHFSHEPEILGTGGALRGASWFLPDSEPFWIINGDIAADVSYKPFLNTCRQSTEKPMAVLWMTDKQGPRTVIMSENKIKFFRGGKPGTKNCFTFCGLHLVSPEIINFIPKGFSSIITAYEKAMRKNLSVLGLCPKESFWFDLGTPQSYLEAHRAIKKCFIAKKPGGNLFTREAVLPPSSLRKKGVKVKGFAAVDKNSNVSKGSFLNDCVIMNNALVTASAVIKNSIIGPNATASGTIKDSITLNASNMRAPTIKRAVKILSFPEKHTSVTQLPPRGSDRTFFRIEHGKKTAIAVIHGSERPENKLYARNARILKKTGIPAPSIIAEYPSKQLVVMEDLGDKSLADFIKDKSQKSVIAIYKRVLNKIHILHSERLSATSEKKLCEPFSPKLYRWERELFKKYFLLPSTDNLSAKRAMNDLSQIARKLLKEQNVLIHRDLQSSNILCKNGNFSFIDFQGMRMGPAVYDLASLICDPYVSLPPSTQKELIKYSAKISRRDYAEFERIFWIAAVQRLTQALGAFGRLGSYRSTSDFSRHIPSALKMMKHALDHLSGMKNLRAFIDDMIQSVENHAHSKLAEITDKKIP